ncbi:hypothetical protein [Blastococcus sp. CT_GayMR16]|uniref:hypothetical protein n=1 Tax=Blastococcus sp. CT_GayMR16 TaxID=2559607 RepID=UPI0010736567|nr:hypothetical protein [Blastococcus sp. CT_GayMR16]TFV86245.1 hypothetical protein E4P38_17205 [Blastococcus sp. CT_GayMR16]
MSRTAWRLAGAFAIGHVVLILAGISQQDTLLLGDDAAMVAEQYVDGDMIRSFAGGYVEALGLLLLLPVIAFLAQAVGRRTEAGSWAARTAFAAGTGYVLLSLAPGLAAGAAAFYGAQHGADVATVSLVNDVRVFAFFMSLLLLGGHTIGIAIGVLTDHVLPAWLGWSAVVTGIVLLGGVPFAVHGVADYATLLWILWFIALATVMLRHRPQGADVVARADRPAAAATSV